MKRLFLFFVIYFVVVSGVFAEEFRPQSKIEEVTVYTGSARVTRVAKVTLPVGEHTVIFEDVVSNIDENSLNVAGLGEAKVTLFGANIQTEQLKFNPNEKVRALEDKIQGLKDQVELKRNFLNILSQQEAYLNSIRLFANNQIPEDLVTKMPTPESLKGVLDFYTEQLKGVYQNRLDTNNGIRELEKEIDVLSRELADLRGPQKNQQRNIVVDLSAQTAGSFTLKVSYLVTGATWRPIYDARAKLSEDKVMLNAFGQVQQWTGDDWTDVKLILSTAQPQRQGSMPYVSPWILTEQQPVPAAYREGRMMQADSIGSQHEAFSTTGSINAAFDKKEVSADIAYVQPEMKGVSVIYEIAKKATVPSDRTEHKFPLSSQTLQADFEYSTYPKASAFAYLGSRVKNGAENHLLAGQTNLYLDEEYVGKAAIDTISPNETFDLYLGVDESVKVSRKQIEKKVDETLIAGIPSPNKKITYRYKIEIENFKAKNAKVKLFESMPAAGTDKIKVKINEVSLKPTEKDWKDRQSIWLWELNLAPNAKQEITYSFTIEYPKDLVIQGLE